MGRFLFFVALVASRFHSVSCVEAPGLGIVQEQSIVHRFVELFNYPAGLQLVQGRCARVARFSPNELVLALHNVDGVSNVIRSIELLPVSLIAFQEPDP